MLNTIAPFVGIIGLLLIGLSLAYRLLETERTTKSFGWLISIGVVLILVSWVLFIIPQVKLPT